MKQTYRTEGYCFAFLLASGSQCELNAKCISIHSLITVSLDGEIVKQKLESALTAWAPLSEHMWAESLAPDRIHFICMRGLMTRTAFTFVTMRIEWRWTELTGTPDRKSHWKIIWKGISVYHDRQSSSAQIETEKRPENMQSRSV